MKHLGLLAALLFVLTAAGCGSKEEGSDVKIYPAGPAGGSSIGRRPGTPGAPASTAGGDSAGQPGTSG